MLPVKYDARSTQRELDKIDNKVNKIEAGGSPTTLAEDLAKGNSTDGFDINVTTGDNINFGQGSRSTYNSILQIYHDGYNSYVSELGTGDLILWGAAKVRIGGPFSSPVLIVNASGSCQLNYSGTKCLETIAGGGIKVETQVEFGALKGTNSVAVTQILDEDNMASNSNTALATQQSIKTYVDSQSATAGELLTTLNGSITDSELASSLSTPIATIPTLTSNLSTLTTNLNTSNGNISDLVDFTGYTAGYSGSDILARLGATETVANSKVTSAQLAAEASARATAIASSALSLQDQIDDLLAIPDYANGTTYAINDQVVYLDKLYIATAATTGNLPTNTSFWDVLGDYSSLGALVADNSADITAINTVTAGSSSAAAQSIAALNSTVNNATTGVAATANALDTVETLVNDSDDGVNASATKISALESTVNNNTTGVAATANALDTVETLVNNSNTGVTASATKISALESTVNNNTTGVAATANALDVVETLVNNSNTGVSASASKISALESTVNNATTGVAATANALDVVETLVNDSDDGVNASASKISALESTVNNATTGVAATANALDTVETLVNDSDDGVAASATKVSALESTINNPTTGLSAVSSALEVVETLVNDSDDGVAASATKISTLNTTVGSNTASIQTQASTINGLTSQFTVKTDVAGKVAGFGLYNDATTGSEFAIAADRFFLTPSPDVTGTANPTNNTQGTSGDIYYATGSKEYFVSAGASSGGYIWNQIETPSPFVVTTSSTTLGGELVPRGVYMDNVYIKNGSVDTLSIANQAVTIPSTVAVAPNTYYEEDDSTWITSVELNVNNSGAKTEIEGQLWFQPAYADGLISMNSIFALLDIQLYTKFYNGSTYLDDSTTANNNVCVTHRNSISHVITSLLTPPANTTRIEIDLKFRVKESGTAWGANVITAKINALEVKK